MDDYNELIPGVKIVLKSLEEATHTHTRGDGARRYTRDGLYINPAMYKYFGREVTVGYIHTETQMFNIKEEPRWDWDISCVAYIGSLEVFDPASEEELADMLFGG